MGFAGFDSLAYPGDDVMAWLKANTNLSFVGFYLAPAPSRPTSKWMGRRALLASQGWDLPTDDPAGSGVAAAAVWQHTQNITLALHAGPVPTLKVDLNCASVADPSQVAVG